MERLEAEQVHVKLEPMDNSSTLDHMDYVPSLVTSNESEVDELVDDDGMRFHRFPDHTGAHVCIDRRRRR